MRFLISVNRQVRLQFGSLWCSRFKKKVSHRLDCEFGLTQLSVAIFEAKNC